MNPSNITYKNNSINQQNRERLLRNSLGESFENQVQKLKLTELHIHNILMNILHDEPVDSFDFSHISTRRITRAFERELEEKRKQEEKRDSRDRSLNNTIFDIEFSEDEELDTEYNPLQNVNNIENPNLVLQNYHSRDWNNDINYPNTRSRHNESAYYMSDEYRCFDTSFAVYDDDPIYKDFLTNLDNNDQCDYSQDEEDDPEFDPSQEPNFFENFDDDDESVKISKSELKQFVEDLDTPNIITDVIVVSPNCETSEDSSSSASRQILSSTPKDYDSEHNSGKQGRRFVQPSPEEYKFYDFSNSASCIHGRGLMTKDEQDQFITQTEMLVQLLLQFIVCYHFDQIDDKYGKMYKDMLNNLLCQQACSSSNSLLRKVRNIYSAVNHYQTLTNLRVDEFNHQLMFPDTLHHTSFKPVHVYSGIVLATSDALMYPKLLPFQKFYISSVQGSVFSRSEINLMKFALARTKESQKQFKNTKSPKYVSIIEKYFPLRTTEQLRWRISSARNSKNKEINSVQFALQNKISYFEDYTKKHSEFNGIIRASFDVGQVLCPLHWLEKWMPEWLRVLKTKIMQGEYSKTFPNLTIPRNTLSEVTKPQNVPTSSVVPVGPKVIIPQGINITQPIQIIQLNEIPQVVKVPVINECSYQNSVDQVKINNNQGNEELKNNSGDRIIDPLEIEKYIAEMQNLKNQKKRNRRNNAYGARNVTDDDFANEPFREYQTSLVPSSQVSTDPTLKNYSRHDLHKIRFHLGMKKQEAIQSGTWDISKDVYDPDEVSEACVKVDEDKKRKETENAERRKRRYNLSKKISNDDNGEGRERKELKLSSNQSQKEDDPYKDLSKLQKKIKRQNDGKIAMYDPFYHNEAMKKISVIIGEDIQQKFSLHKGMLIELEELLNQYGNDQKKFIEKLEQSWGSHFEFMTQLVSILLDESNLTEEMCTNPTRVAQTNALEIIRMIYIYCHHSRGKISARNVFRTIEKEFQGEGNEIMIGKRLLEIFKKETPIYNYLKRFVQLDIDIEDLSDEEEFIDAAGGDIDFSGDENNLLYF